MNCILQWPLDNVQYIDYYNRQQIKRGGFVKTLSITLTEQELSFLENMQKLINSHSPQEKCTLEDVIHECIKNAISLGADMHRGQA